VPNYRVYGLAIDSELPLPELPRGHNALAAREDARPPTTFEVTVRFGEVHFLGVPGARVVYKPVTRNEIIVHYEKVGTALVRDGIAVTLKPAEAVDPLALRLFVLQQVFGVLLLQRGLFVLHASAASWNGGAVAFAGPSGEGKSTIVAGLHRESFSVIADDVLAIDAKCRTALPGLVQLKLTEETRSRLTSGIVATQSIGDRTSKRLCELQGAPVREAIPLRAIYLLETGLAVEFVSVSPARAAIELVRHTYGARLIHAIGLSARHFQQAAELARHVPVTILRRPRDLALLPQIVEGIKQRLPWRGPSGGEFGFRQSQIGIDPTAGRRESSRP
jgi:hypothetical protein